MGGEDLEDFVLLAWSGRISPSGCCCPLHERWMPSSSSRPPPHVQQLLSFV